MANIQMSLTPLSQALRLQLTSFNTRSKNFIIKFNLSNAHHETKCTLSGQNATFKTHEPWPDNVPIRLPCTLQCTTPRLKKKRDLLKTQLRGFYWIFRRKGCWSFGFFKESPTSTLAEKMFGQFIFIYTCFPEQNIQNFADLKV